MTGQTLLRTETVLNCLHITVNRKVKSKVRESE